MKHIYLLLAIALCFISKSFAQSPELIKDINTQHSGARAPSQLTEFNGFIYYFVESSTGVSQLWRTDGSITEMVYDLNPGVQPVDIAIWQNTNALYFSTDTEGLYAYNGIGVSQASPATGEIIPGQNVLYLYETFTDPNTSSTAQRLFVYDPVEIDPTLIIEYTTVINDREFTIVGDDMYMTDFTDATGEEVFYVELTGIGGGTLNSTITALDNAINGSVGSDPANLTEFNGKCYWVALKDNSNGNGTGPKALYESDGTVIGTTEFFTYDADITLPLYLTTPKTTDIAVINSRLLYYNMSGSTSSIDVDVYSYDGTNPPTAIQQITNNAPGSIQVLNRLQFLGQIAAEEYYDIPGVGDYSTDGSTTSVSALTFNQTIHIDKMVRIGSSLIYAKFDDDENLYLSDLSGNESVIYTFSSAFSQDRPKSLTALGPEAFFLGVDDTDGIQIWKTDGTNPNTTKVTTSSFAATRGSFSQRFFEFNGEIYFTAIPEFGSANSNLYKTDGTEANTVEVINNNPDLVYEDGVTYSNAYFFNAINILKKFDGTTVTTIKSLEAGASNLTASGSNLFFTSTSSGEGTELWVSNGTDPGTVPLDLFPGASFSSSPDQLVDISGTLYFRAVDPIEGTKGLWKSDGTPGGTVVVFSDVIGDIDDITVIGDQIFFTVDDLTIGEEVKVYNTATETTSEIDLVEGAGDGFPRDLVNFNGSLYLTYQFAVNTRAIAKLNPADLTFTNIFYFNATDAAYSSGESTVTSGYFSFRVSDTFSSFNRRLTVTASDFVSINDTETWNNPQVVQDIVYFDNSGTLYESDGFVSKGITSNVNYRIGFNDQLIFPFDNGTLGSEPHKYISDRQGVSITSSSNLQFTQDGTSVNVTLDAGTGDGRLLLVSTVPNLNLSEIEDGQVYTADPMFLSSTTSLAAPDEFSSSHLVAKGDISAATVTDFTLGQTYYFTVIEYSELGVDDLQYDLIGSYQSSFEAVKLDQTITFQNPGETLTTETVALDATSTSGLEVNYIVSSGPAAISGSNLTFNGAGEVTITLNQSGNNIYNPANELVLVFDVIKDDQIITIDIPDAATYLDGPISFTPATNNASIALTHSITGPGQLSNTNDEITITGAGTIEVTISNEGNNLYNPVSVTKTITVAKADHALTISTINDQTYNTTFTLLYGTDIIDSAPAGSPTGDITVTIVSGPAEVNPTNTQQITVTGVGTVTFEVSNSGNNNYNPAPTVQGTFEAIKADQSLTLNGSLPTEVPFTDGTYSFENQYSSLSGDVSFVIISGPGFFNGENMDIYNITETGEVTISAFAPSNEFYNGSLATEFSFNVIKGDQSIFFDGITNQTTVSNMVYDPNGFEFNASATSGLDVVFELTQNATAGSFNGNLLTVTSTGSFEVTISQAGDANYNAATPLTLSITIVKADQTITATDITDKLKSDGPFSVEASSSSGLAVEITTVNTNISLDGTTVSLNTDAPAGQATIDIAQPGNDLYNAAIPVSLSFCISPVAPTIMLENGVISSDNLIDQHDWYKDGVFLQVSDNSNNTFSPTESGTYTAIAQGGACPDSDFSNEIIYTKTDPVLGLEDELETLVYPVPTRDFLNISPTLLNKKNLRYEIFNLSGKQLIIGEVTQKLDVSSLRNGVYLLRIPSELIQIPFIKE